MADTLGDRFWVVKLQYGGWYYSHGSKTRLGGWVSGYIQAIRFFWDRRTWPTKITVEWKYFGEF